MCVVHNGATHGSLTQSLTHSLIHSLTQPLTHSLTQSPSHSLVHAPTDTLTYSSTHLLLGMQIAPLVKQGGPRHMCWFRNLEWEICPVVSLALYLHWFFDMRGGRKKFVMPNLKANFLDSLILSFVCVCVSVCLCLCL